jgi:hypothetical protein
MVSMSFFCETRSQGFAKVPTFRQFSPSGSYNSTSRHASLRSGGTRSAPRHRSRRWVHIEGALRALADAALNAMSQ